MVPRAKGGGCVEQKEKRGAAYPEAVICGRRGKVADCVGGGVGGALERSRWGDPKGLRGETSGLRWRKTCCYDRATGGGPCARRRERATTRPASKARTVGGRWDSARRAAMVRG